MARTSPTHESVINGLDSAMTFAFALLGEMAREHGLVRLRELAEETREAVREHSLGLLELGKKSHTSDFASGLVSSVINRLQSAVVKKKVPELPDLNSEWIDLSRILSAAHLELFHQSGFKDLVSISGKILHQVDSTFPKEAKPFISVAQFDAVGRAVLVGAPSKEKWPIHIPSLIGGLHTNFLDSITAGRSPILTQEELEHLVQRYCAKVEQEYLEVIRQIFVVRMVQRLFPKAVNISIPLEKYYRWGALCKRVPSARELLLMYSALNRAQAVSDSKFRPRDDEKEEPEMLSADVFIHWCEGEIPRPLIFRWGQIFFDTDRSDIKINGLNIQKHGVMAISYAEPMPGIEELATRFGVFLLNARRAYCRATGGIFRSEEVETLKRVQKKADELSREGRALLHDKSSVLGVLCALMDLEMQQDPNFATRPNKVRIIEIHDRMRSAGFTLSCESIRKSCAKGDFMQKSIQEFLMRL